MKKLVLIMVMVLMASTASAALLQGYCNDYRIEDGSVPGVWEYIEQTIWGQTHSCIFTADGSGIVGYNGQTEVTPTSVHGTGIANSGWNTDWWQGGGMGGIDANREYLRQDLGAVYNLGTAYLWPYESDVSIADFNIRVSTDSDPRTATWSAPIGPFNLAMYGGSGDISAQAFDLGGVAARLVEIDVISAYHASGWAGLFEAAFAEAEEEPEPVIPEPAGLGLVGLALLAVRKRRS